MELGCKTASRDRRKAEKEQHGALGSWGSRGTQQDRGMLAGGEFGGWAVRAPGCPSLAGSFVALSLELAGFGYLSPI